MLARKSSPNLPISDTPHLVTIPSLHTHQGATPVYTLPDPPYLLLVAGLLASLASGKAFEVTLKQSVQKWSKTRSTKTLGNLQGMQLLIPFLGIAGGSWIFLGSGLMIFGFAAEPCYLLSLILTTFISLLVWFQLGKLLLTLEQGGSQALDLDSW